MDDLKIGVISDTHGLLRQEALEALKGCDTIIHAGDIGGQRVLEGLSAVAPVVAVRGNMDGGEWADSLPSTEVVQVGPTLVYVIHDLCGLDIDPAAAGFGAVICGHSHRPVIESLNGVFHINPGSAGPRRFELPVSVAIIRLRDGVLEPLLIDLNPRISDRKR